MDGVVKCYLFEDQKREQMFFSEQTVEKVNNSLTIVNIWQR